MLTHERKDLDQEEQAQLDQILHSLLEKGVATSVFGWFCWRTTQNERVLSEKQSKRLYPAYYRTERVRGARNFLLAMEDQLTPPHRASWGAASSGPSSRVFQIMSALARMPISDADTDRINIYKEEFIL